MDLDPTRLPLSLGVSVAELTQRRASPVRPRDAASTVLLRGGDRGLEVFLLRRHSRMAFAPDVAVFPGGGVDARDLDPAQAFEWVGPSPREWAHLLGVPTDVARGVVCAAVRELFEETGVLLAAGADGVLVDGVDPSWEEDRGRLESREQSFAELLRGRGLSLRTDLLRPWSCWTTPDFEPRRYRTFFFVVELPARQQTRDVSTESVETVWAPVATALRNLDAMALLPPQLCICAELFEYASPAEVVRAAERRIPRVVTPTAVVDGGEVRLGLPEDLVELTRSVGRRL